MVNLAFHAFNGDKCRGKRLQAIVACKFALLVRLVVDFLSHFVQFFLLLLKEGSGFVVLFVPFKLVADACLLVVEFSLQAYV